jgi:hypothetical protein
MDEKDVLDARLKACKSAEEVKWPSTTANLSGKLKRRKTLKRKAQVDTVPHIPGRAR